MYILRKVKHFIYFLLFANYRQQDKLKKEIDRLRLIPRFQLTETFLWDKKIKIPDAASFLFIYDEMFNKEIYKFNAKSENPLIIDCGANIGLSVHYFKKILPNSQIIAFEPDPKIFEILNHNVSAFNYSDVRLFNNALWKEEKELDFYSEGADAGTLFNSGSFSNNTVKIKALKLSDFLNKPVDLLKIDIEGAEYMVLKECENLLQNVDKLFVEYHSFVKDEQYLDEILSMLKKAGFRYNIQHIGVFSRHPFIAINSYAGMDLQLNIFAYR